MKATAKKAGAMPHLSIAFVLLFVALVVVFSPPLLKNSKWEFLFLFRNFRSVKKTFFVLFLELILVAASAMCLPRDLYEDLLD